MLNHKRIKEDPEKLIKFQHFIDKCNSKEINYPLEKHF